MATQYKRLHASTIFLRQVVSCSKTVLAIGPTSPTLKPDLSVTAYENCSGLEQKSQEDLGKGNFTFFPSGHKWFDLSVIGYMKNNHVATSPL